jgi:hypothetical protein
VFFSQRFAFVCVPTTYEVFWFFENLRVGREWKWSAKVSYFWHSRKLLKKLHECHTSSANFTSDKVMTPKVQIGGGRREDMCRFI